MNIVTNQIKMRDYGLWIGAFCVKLHYKIWVRRRVGKPPTDPGVRGGYPFLRSPKTVY